MTTEKQKKRFRITDEAPFEALRIIVSILIALVVTFIVLCVVIEGDSLPQRIGNAWTTFIALMTYPCKNLFYFGYVLVKMVPLTFAGLATLLYFRTGLFNLSTEGIFYFAGVACTYFAVSETRLTGNAFIDSAICIIAAGLCGGVIALLPGILKAKFQADEMVISLMMNNILFGIGFWIIKTYLATTGVTGTSSAPFVQSARLTTIIPKTQVHSGIILVLIMVVFVYILLFKTKIGYAIRITGLNQNFARYSGMGAFGLFMVVHFLAGFIGGMGSAVEAARRIPELHLVTASGDLGFTGALMAMLGKNHPIGVAVAAFGISYSRASAQLLANSSPVIDIKLVSVVEVILTLLISSQYFLRGWRERQLLKEEKI